LPGVRFAALTRRLLPGSIVVAGLLATAPGAMAADGVGVYGRTDDKVVTFFAFGLIAFFAILVTVLSLIQIRLENRKERRMEDLERLGSR
jgi:putative copper export protein